MPWLDADVRPCECCAVYDTGSPDKEPKSASAAKRVIRSWSHQAPAILAFFLSLRQGKPEDFVVAGSSGQNAVPPALPRQHQHFFLLGLPWQLHLNWPFTCSPPPSKSHGHHHLDFLLGTWHARKLPHWFLWVLPVCFTGQRASWNCLSHHTPQCVAHSTEPLKCSLAE